MTGRLVFLPLTLIAMMLAGPLSASQSNRQGHHGQGYDALHHWYLTLKDKRGRSCCDLLDCRPSQSRVRGRNVEVLVDGEWTRVPPDKILPLTSPDLGTHVCSPGRESNYPRGHIFCVVLGSGV